MRKFLGVPAMLAVCMLAVTPAQAQFGSLLRKATTPAPKPSSDDNGGCPKGKKGSSIGRNILGNVLNDAVGDAASKAGVYSYVPIGEVSGTLTDAIACRPRSRRASAGRGGDRRGDARRRGRRDVELDQRDAARGQRVVDRRGAQRPGRRAPAA